MSEIDPEFLKQLQEAFVIEAREQLQNIMNNIIQLESSSDEDAKNGLAENILHELHSMKGNSRAAGITTVESICQYLESALLSLRRKKELLHADAADVFHSAIDLLDQYISQVEAGNADYIDEGFANVIQGLKYLDERQRLADEAAAAAALAEQAAGPSAPGSPPSPTSSPAAPPVKAAEPDDAQAGPEQSTSKAIPPANPNEAALAAPNGAAKAAEPAAPAQPTAPQRDAMASQARDAAPAMTATQTAAPATQKTKGLATDKGGTTRIALWKLDKLLRESEEMLILKQITEQRLEDCRELRTEAKHLSAEVLSFQRMLKERAQAAQRESAQGSKELGSFISWLSGFSETLESKINSQMRRQQQEQRLCFNMVDGFIDSVKSLLMQDFSGLLSVVPKVVRDLSRELRKDVDLELFGTEIEIDRRILEEIKDPVIHLVRNSLDHGLETSEDRLAAGKAPKASVRIGAVQNESGNVELIIADDGRGINTARLKAVAVREGAITQDEADSMSENEALELMYRSAVSTSETVTEISGRGIGMAIVRERIHDLGGRIIVETVLGKGTTFRLQLPTKLSTFRGIQINAAGQSFIIPTLNVDYAGRVLRSEIKQQGSRNIINVNEKLVSVQYLADVLQINYKTEFKTRAARKYQQLIILESGDRTAGFLVDEILHEHEVLVRGLSHPLIRVPNIAGATILGSGQVVPVLNVADLMESSLKALDADRKLTEQLHQQSQRAQKLSEMPVYLVDKHSTSLVMLKTLLESEGYIVNTFDTNEAALEGLDVDEPLILLKSAELSETQESGLAYWVRRDLRLKDIPIIFFGSESAENGKKASLENGGNAYFSKIDFDRKQLLELIETLT
ncbi:MAG: chemotaxis protein CheW [Candidatus Obscuribacterales bacterium]|nr:chemotaxis protein CheW [Candidatus Obscuribacterales bacterium]